jgi:integrase
LIRRALETHGLSVAKVKFSDFLQDFDEGLLHVRVTKNSKARWIPLNSSLRQLLEKMRVKRSEALPDKPVMQVFECQKSIDRAAKLAGVKRITHHDLRHLFATRRIENDVDISRKQCRLLITVIAFASNHEACLLVLVRSAIS